MTPPLSPIPPHRPGGPSRVLQGSFPGGQPRFPQPAPPPPAPVASRPASVQPAVAPGRPGPIPPATRQGPAAGRPGPILPTAARPGAVQPSAPLNPTAPPPIAPAAPRPAAIQPSGGNAFALPPGFQLRPSALGQRLPDAVQQKMEAAFGASFADVRVHVGNEAASIGALAFTIGSDLYFAPGQYNPQTMPGQQLLGHELAHVVQQRAGRVRNPLGAGLAVVQDPALEAEAERMGRRAATVAVPASAPVQAKPASGSPVGGRAAGLLDVRGGRGVPPGRPALAAPPPIRPGGGAGPSSMRPGPGAGPGRDGRGMAGLIPPDGIAAQPRAATPALPAARADRDVLGRGPAPRSEVPDRANGPRVPTAPIARPARPDAGDGTVQPMLGLIGLGLGAIGLGTYLYDRYIASDVTRLRLRRYTSGLPLVGDSEVRAAIDQGLGHIDAGRAQIEYRRPDNWGEGETARPAAPGMPHSIRIDPSLSRGRSLINSLHELTHVSVDRSPQFAAANPPGPGGFLAIPPGSTYGQESLQNDNDLVNASAIVANDPGLDPAVRTYLLDRIEQYARINPVAEYDTVVTELLFYLYLQGVPKSSPSYQVLRTLAQNARLRR